jgi:hypothetical protein
MHKGKRSLHHGMSWNIKYNLQSKVHYVIIDIVFWSYSTHLEKLHGEGNQGKKNLKIYGNCIDLALKKYVEIEDGGCTIRIGYRFYNIHESSLKGYISTRYLTT